MEQKKKNQTLIFVILAILLGISCIVVSSCAFAMFWFLNRDSSQSATTVIEQTVPVLPTDEPSLDDSSDSAVETPDATGLTERQRKVIARAEKIRGLKAQGEFKLIYRTPDELRDYLVEDFYQDASTEDFKNDQDLLALLGFTPQDFDLESFYLDFYAEQISGFYDQEKNEMVLVEGGSETENTLTLAHEYTHFLQFDHFKLLDKLNYTNERCDADPEYCLTISALLEGDATLTEILLNAEPDLGLYEEQETPRDTSVFDNAPQYFQDSLLFPYTYGYDFVSTFYRREGFDGVNKLYENPPASVEQVMHPKRYPEDLPMDMLIEPFQEVIADHCDAIQQNVLNEADLLWLLSSGHDASWRIPKSTAETAVEGWGGGAFQFSRCSESPLFFSKTAWDTQKDADEFTRALMQYANLRWGESSDEGSWIGADGEQVRVLQQDDVVFFVIAPESFPTDELLFQIDRGRAL